MIELIITGQPVAKGRPKFSRFGKFTKVYTPEKTVNYETLVKLSFQEKYPNFEILQNALRMDITAFFDIPKSASKKKYLQMIEGKIRPTKKPDRDNIEKIIGDALNGIAYKDDSQIVEGETKKLYSDNPRVEIKINEVL